jgi:Ser/Thr protein kinase RdoA (MazF antagonist)
LPADEAGFLRQAYGLTAEGPLQALHRGENLTYLARRDHERLVIRRYRAHRFTPPQIAGEIAWMDALQKAIPVPAIVPTIDHQRLLEWREAGTRCHYVAFRWIDGGSPSGDQPGHHAGLGRLTRQLHDAAADVMATSAPDWSGWCRPHYDPGPVVQQGLANLLASPFIAGEDARLCQSTAERLLERVDCLQRAPSRFVHADLHLGNVLASGTAWHCLDFDECGFGPQAFDLGVARLHLRATNRLAWWPAFAEGYGGIADMAAVKVATALRIWYMAGKIPQRQDLETLRREPAARIRRYCGYVALELNGDEAG